MGSSGKVLDFVDRAGDTMSGNLLFSDVNEGVQFISSAAMISASAAGAMVLSASASLVATSPLFDFTAVTQTQVGVGSDGAPGLTIGATTNGLYQFSSTNVRFQIGGADKWGWGSTTNDTFQTIQPSASNTMDIGQTSRRFRRAYFGTTVDINVATGTAPLVIASTTACTNLNADMVDGRHVSTSGNAVPAMNGANTWSANQTFTTSSKVIELSNSTGGTLFSFSITSGNVLTFGTTTGAFFTLSNAAGVVVNEDGLSAFDFRVESDTSTHAIFVDSSANFVGIMNSTPGYELDVNGTFNINGTAGKTFRWNAASTAPATTPTPVFTDFYGGNTKALGDPTGWVLVNVAGTDRKIPFYAT